MRKHLDNEGAVRSVTITRSEWRRLGRRRRRRTTDRRGRAYVWVVCEQQGRVRVRAMIVADRSPEARRKVCA
ncbi:MAG: hypothetical protein REI11_14685 [Patulibacter sp.]|nr:hypothetical protein [Patulibacter sp.]